MSEEEKITQWFINNINGTPSEEQLALRKVYELNEEIERLNNKVEELMTLYTTEREVKEDYKSIIKEVREYINTDKNCIPKHIKDYINNLLDKVKENI